MGIGEGNKDFRALKSVQAFDEFRGIIDQMYDMILVEAESEKEAIEGMRFLLRSMAMSSEIAGDANPRLPFFQRMDTAARKIGGDNPDAEYDIAVLDGQYNYKITGNIGNVKYFSFSVSGGKGKTPSYGIGYIKDSDLQADENGDFTLWLSKTRPSQPGAWIQITEDAANVLVRQYIGDRSKEQLATYSIEAVGDNLPPIRPPKDAEIAQNIEATGHAFLTLSAWGKTIVEKIVPELSDNPNTFFKRKGKQIGGQTAEISNLYFMCLYSFADDEALVIELEPPRSRYWNFTMNSIWRETPEYLNRPVSLTMDGAHKEADGKVRFVVSHQDMGHPNWIDTSGHHRGFLTFRSVEGEDMTEPKLKKMKLTAVKDFLEAPIF
jgi:hypothetical protein